MRAYLPSDALVVAMLALILAAEVVLGWSLARWIPSRVARWIAWLELAAVVLGVDRLCGHEPAGVRMLALIAAGMLAMKTVVLVEDRARNARGLAFPEWLGFALLWPGMRPSLFARRAADVLSAGAAAPISRTLPGARRMIVHGAVRIVVGTLLVASAHFAWQSTHDPWIATALILVGSSVAVHFGIFDVLAGTWRLAGVACEEPFRAPWRAQSLSDFWGTRWNLAFSEMTSTAVYRPLARRFGASGALLASFALSGLLHEMAISLPVRAGFGLPFAYFALHGALVSIERELARRGHPVQGWPGRAWTFAWLVAPLPILFHRPFLAAVVWPIAGIVA